MTEALTTATSNTTDNPVGDPELAAMYGTVRFSVHFILTPSVVVIGVVGNIISMIVLTRRRMRSSTNSYLTALAVSDTLYLLLTFTLSLRHIVAGLSHPDHRLYWHFWRYALWLLDASSEYPCSAITAKAAPRSFFSVNGCCAIVVKTKENKGELWPTRYSYDWYQWVGFAWVSHLQMVGSTSCLLHFSDSCLAHVYSISRCQS